MNKRGSASKKGLIVFSIWALLCFTWVELPEAQNGPSSSYVADELLIQLIPGTPRERVNEILQSLGAFIEKEIPQIKTQKIKVPSHALDEVKRALSRNLFDGLTALSSVEGPHIHLVIENNYIAEGSAIPNDENYSSQWHLSKISSPRGWDISTGSDDISIAIIDSGVDPTHPDLSGKLLPGFNFVDDNADTHDLLGHGTAVAGVAAALSDNFTGVAGVAWDNPILPLVVINSDNWASYYDIAQAITYAADQGVKVINISIGGTSSSSTLQKAVNYAWNKGAVIVAAAMNSATDEPNYPAACENVIGVSATTSSDTLTGYSSYGDWIKLSAPGEYILTTNNGGGYASWSGTSFSSPMTAGLAALVFSANPLLSNSQVVEILTQNADDLGSPGFDSYFGHGRINVHRSLVAAVNTLPNPDTTAPTASITSPADQSPVSGAITITVSTEDNVGVSKVEFYINGALFATTNAGPFSFYWDTTGNADGTYKLVSFAYDPSGNIGQSKEITVYVNNSPDTAAPQVSITSPSNGSYISGEVTITVSASDNVEVSRIELYVDDQLRTVVSNQNSFIWEWNAHNLSIGKHVVSAKAFDPSGNVSIGAITVYKSWWSNFRP